LVTPPGALAGIIKDMNPDGFVSWKDLTKILQVYDEAIGEIKGSQKILAAIGLGNLTAILVCVGLLVQHVLK
jgi:hypothetical protein